MHSAFKPAFKKFATRDDIHGANKGPGYPGAGRFHIKQGRLKDRDVVIEFDS